MEQTKMQKALGVLIINSLLCVQCATIKKKENTEKYSDNNKIKVYKSHNDFFSGFVIDSYADNKRKYAIPNTTYVNDVLLTNYDKSLDFDIAIATFKIVPSTVIKVKNNQKHEVQVFAMGYLPTKKMEFHVKQGDSIVIKSYLKEDNRPIIHYRTKN